MNKYLSIKNAIAVALLAIVGLALASRASAEPTLDGTFTPSGQPGQMALGPDGNVWFTLATSSDGKDFGKIAPDGTITEYDTPNGQSVFSLTTGPAVLGGPKDQIWLTQNGKLVKWSPTAEDGTIISLPELDGPRGITADSDGYMWVVDDFGSLIRVSPSGDTVEHDISGSGGRGIALDSDGNLWWADFGQAKVHRSNPATPAAPVSFDVGGGPQEVAAGPGGQIAYTNQGDFPHTVGLISNQGQLTEVEVPGTDPFGITFAADKAYWVANFASNDMTRLSTSGQVTSPIEFPAGSGPRYLAEGKDGTLWVGLETSQQIARITGLKSDEGSGQVKLVLSGVKLMKGKKLRIRANLTKDANVRITLDRRKGKRFVKVRSVTRPGTKGSNLFKLARPARKGSFRVRIVARSGDEKAGLVIRKFKVKKG